MTRGGHTHGDPGEAQIALLFDQEDARTFAGAIRGVMMAGFYVMQEERWPGFIAFIEQIDGQQCGNTPPVMDMTLQVIDTLKKYLLQVAKLPPDKPYESRFPDE